MDRDLFFRTSHLTNLMSKRDFFPDVQPGATNFEIGRVLISGDKSTSRHCVWCIPNTNITIRVLFGSFHVLTGIPGHHLKHDDSPHTHTHTHNNNDEHTGEVRPFIHTTVSLGTFWRSCVSFHPISHRWSGTSLSTSFSCDSLNTFTMLGYPCRCVNGSHVWRSAF